ncbi:hypothetical protein TKK_0004257 [Trichogramma kaykai]
MKLGHELAESRGRWPRLTDDLLAELQSWAGGHGLPEVPPEQLAIFAHSCHYEREATLACMDCYYRLRAQVPDFFAARDPTSQASLNALKVVYFAALPKPDKQGNRIIFHGLADGAPSRYQFADSVKLLLMSMDASLHEVGCVPGHVFLFDMRGVGIGHLTRLSLAGIKRFFEYIQDAMPVRLKAIHVLNCVWFIDRVLALVKPFMKKELMDILHLHTGSVSEVYRYIPPECLPKDFGGELDDIETLHQQHCRKLADLRDYFQEEERLFRCFKNNAKKLPVSSSDKDVAERKSEADERVS